MLPRLLSLALLSGCIENGLRRDEDGPPRPGDDAAAASSGVEPVTDGTGVDPNDDDHYKPLTLDHGATLRGTVTVLPMVTDTMGNQVEGDWAPLTGGVYPFGAIWVDTFVDVDGEPDFRSQTALLTPSTGPNPFELHVSDGPLYVQAMVDKDADGIIGVAEPSALWHDRLEVRGGQVVDSNGEVVEEVNLYVSASWAVSTDDGGGDRKPRPGPVTVSGTSRVERSAGSDCGAMLFSANWYGPYYWTFFHPGTPWSMQVLPDQGEMHLAASCDANGNQLLDPADHWGTWVSVKGVEDSLVIAENDIGRLHLRDPVPDVFTTAEPIVELSGSIAEPEGGYPPGAVLYVVAERNDQVPDLAALEHEYAYTTVSGAALHGIVPFSLTVPAWKQTWVWAWVDLDGDGIINEPGEPGGATGPWYTEMSMTDLGIRLQPAASP
jgi:hypothetical protein